MTLPMLGSTPMCAFLKKHD
uniref:Uncharacterized protein n=1 Tax=Anguilla anguilla TaxID=7936 RepID=A0A0E9PYH2_ANGAN